MKYYVCAHGFAKGTCTICLVNGIELDPFGLSAKDPGAKLDAGKNRLGLVLGGFSRALQEVGKVGTFGAAKYSDNGWKSVEKGLDRYTDALYRHLMQEASGELSDQDSQLLHAAHTAWNALARLELLLSVPKSSPHTAESAPQSDQSSDECKSPQAYHHSGSGPLSRLNHPPSPPCTDKRRAFAESLGAAHRAYGDLIAERPIPSVVTHAALDVHNDQ